MIADHLTDGIENPSSRNEYLSALKYALEYASGFQPLGRNRILTHYDVEDFLRILEEKLNKEFIRPNPIVIQNYSNSYVAHASGLSLLFFKDLSRVSAARRRALFSKSA